MERIRSKSNGRSGENCRSRRAEAVEEILTIAILVGITSAFAGISRERAGLGLWCNH